MRILILTIALAVMTGCSQRAFKQAKKHYDKLQEILLLHPELADSFKITKHDTTHSDGIKVKVENSNDSVGWDNSFFGEVDTLAKAVVNVPKDAPKPEKAAPIMKLQEKICPELNADSTYHIKVYNSEFTMWIPINLKVKAKGGKLSVNLDSEPVKVPETRIVTQVQFKPLIEKFWQDQWFWVAVALFVVLVFVLVYSIRRR